jgi:trehalose 6-phosphate phosphatase
VVVIPAAQRALRRLAGSPDTAVAFVSGRTLTDLAPRVRVGGATYHGDHGAEWAIAPRGFRAASLSVEREPVDPAVTAMAERLKLEVPHLVDADWLVVEDKGPALTFHFRRAPDIEGARARVRAAVDMVDPDRLLDQPGGRRAWEMRPHRATTKAQTLARLIESHRPDAVLVLGDDAHDAAAFDVLRAEREARRIEGLAIAVASPASDTAEMARHADIVFAGADVTARFLTLLAQARDDRS